MRSWKTTATGIMAILTALIAVGQALVAGHQPDYTTALPSVMAGFGLIFARDNNVTSAQAGAEPAAPATPPTPVH